MDDMAFMQMRDATTLARFEMCDKKSRSYTKGSDDRLNNFKELASLLGGTPRKVLGVYWGKHALAFIHWLKTGEEGSEGVESTMDDLLNYLDLARAMHREGK
jgi:hypothetical protein